MRIVPLCLLFVLPFFASCRSLSKEVNQALPDFLRSKPGGEEMRQFRELREARDWSAEELARQDELHAELTKVYAAGDWEECAELAADYIDEYTVSRHDQEVRFLRADSLYRDDEWSEAFDAFKAYLELYPVSSSSAPAMQMLYRMGLDHIEGRRSALFGLFSREAAGVEILRTLVETFPGGARAADAQWALARYSMRESEYEAAAEEFRVLVERWPESEWHSAALYYTAWCQYRGVKGPAYDPKGMERARIGFEKYLRDARHQGWAGEAKAAMDELTVFEAEHLLTVAEWYIDMEKPWAARYWLVKLSVQHGGTPAGQKARTLLAALTSAADAGVAPAPKGAP